jgi:hypothetical protein
MKRYGEGYWLKVVKAQGEGRLSAAEFCRKKNLSRSTFLRWRSQLSQRVQAGHFVEIGEDSKIASRSKGLVIEVAVDGAVRIQVSAGGDAREIGALVSAIRNAL